MQSVEFTVKIGRGSIYLPCDVCERWLNGVEHVALLARDADVLIVPLTRSPGGLLLKLRNSRGDRVIHASEFLRGLGIPEDLSERCYSVQWRSDLAALEIRAVN